ncbi:MAG: alanine racemase [Chloroherpetonaceae bacterium]|nr:alanine racemase [Chloroherpetonaceae bacterium]MDW8438122.1 alanine racemase [Chloroherpetonaceae bacterium]
MSQFSTLAPVQDCLAKIESASDAPSLSEALISLGNLRHNVREVKRLVGKERRIMAIVKANAYSHGIDLVAPTLVAEGVRDFGVANINEAIQLRKLLDDESVQILAFASPLLPQLELYVKHDVALCLGDFETMRLAEAIAQKFGKPINAHLKIDTGMGRLGVAPKDALALAEAVERSEHLNLQAVFTHFASSDSDRAFTRHQLSLYKSLVAEIERRLGRSLLKHAANSGAVISERESYFDMVRPGILLYGYAPRTDLQSSLSLKPVMQLQAKVIFVKTVERGASISYGRKWRAPRRTRIATIAIGYYDGYHRNLTNKAKVSINGKFYDQVGAVTMDAIMANLGNDTSVRTGDTAVLFGWSEGCGANVLADKEGAIVYELLCSVSPRVRRVAVE